jgi:hypothetical protein
MTTCPFGFRLKGAVVGERRLVDWQAAFAAYAACDPRAHLDCEAYLSAFTFGTDFRARADSWGVLDTKDFGGACWAPWVWWDIDRRGDLDLALRETRRLAVAIDERFALASQDDLLLFLSGHKGFHVGCPTCLWGPEPSPDFHRIARQFAVRLAEVAGIGVYDSKRGYRIDEGVYLKVQLFRAPNSRHPRSRRYKRRLSFDELMGLQAERIVQLAERPEPFDVPAPAYRSDRAAADWQGAARAVVAEAGVKAQRQAAAAVGTPRLNRLTLEFLCNGAEEGHRHRLLFSAAANLRELGCPAPLAHALLTPAGLDSGLPPREVHRQIECGLAHRGDPVEAPAEMTPLPPAVSAPDGGRLQTLLEALWSGAAPADGPAPGGQAVPAPAAPEGKQLQAALAALWETPTAQGAAVPAVDQAPPAAAEDLAEQEEERKAIQAEGRPRDVVTPPPGARLHFGDQDRRPCPAARACFWTWEGAPRWFHVAEHPLPIGRSKEEGQ